MSATTYARHGGRHALDVDRADIVYPIAVRLGYYFWSRGLLPELLSLVDDLTALPSTSQLDEGAHGRLLWARAAMSIEVGLFDGARVSLDEAVRIGQRLGDTDLVLRARTALSYIADDSDLPATRRALEDGISELRRSGDLANTAYTLAALGQAITRLADLEGSRRAYQECLQLAERMHNDHLQTLSLHQLGFTALLGDQPDLARQCFVASLAANANLVDQEGLACCLDGFAVIARTGGQPQAAARLHGAAAHRREVLGVAVWRVLRPFLETQVETTRRALGDARFQDEWATGAHMPPAQALSLADETTAAREPAAPD